MCTSFLFGLALLCMLYAVNQALELKREGAKCHLYKDEMDTIQNSVDRHGTAHG